MEAQQIPNVGDDIYVDTSLYIGHGIDDFMGGKAQVWEVYEEHLKGGGKIIWVTVVEHPNTRYNWRHLEELQEKLKQEFGERRAYPCPDLKHDFNEEMGMWMEAARLREAYKDKIRKGQILGTRSHGF